MIKRSISAVTLTLVLATVAHANLTASNPTDVALSLGTHPLASVPKVEPPVVYAANIAPTPTTLNDTGDRPQVARPAPRLVELPSADAPNQGYTAPLSNTVSVNQPDRLSQNRSLSTARELGSSDVPAVTHQTAEGRRGFAKAPSRPASADRPAGYRTAKWSGGEGATWKSGRDAYGFSGTFGGCRIRGITGPRGYKLDRTC